MREPVPRRRGARLRAFTLAAAIITMSCTTGGETDEPTVSGLQKFSYGDSPQQFGFLSLPGGDGDEPLPVVVLVHGGFWSNRFGVDLMAPLADDLSERGYAVWNLEYRRLGDDGGGFPATLADVAAGIDHLAVLADASEATLDLDRITAIGHSAGGHLVLWSAGRSQATVTVETTLGLAAVSDLFAAVETGVGADAILELIGGTPEEEPERYAAAQPAAPMVGSVTLIHGQDDRVVPVSQSVESAARLSARLILLPEVGHFDLIDPAHPAWHDVVDLLSD